jgi:hypothetical protein
MPKHRKKKKSGSFLTTPILLAILAVVIVGGLYVNRKEPTVKRLLEQALPTASEEIPIAEYLAGKQEIQDAFTGLPDITGDPDLSWNSNQSEKILMLTLTKDSVMGVFQVTVRHPETRWEFLNPKLTIKGKDNALSSLFVTNVAFFAASPTSAPLKKPTFTDDEDIYIKLALHGAHIDKDGANITQSLRIFDSENTLIAAKAPLAKFHGTPSGETIPFTNKIGHLPAGHYYLEFSFRDEITKALETHWQEVDVRKPPQAIPQIKRVNYASDAAFKQPRTEASFVMGETIYLKMILDGFKPTNGKVSGTVSLTITGSDGKVVAQKPKFAAFTQSFDPQKRITVTGSFRLNDPDVYLLTFRIEDFFTKLVTVHDEKLLVRLPKK